MKYQTTELDKNLMTEGFGVQVMEGATGKIFKLKNKCCADCSCEESMQPCEACGNNNALHKN